MATKRAHIDTFWSDVTIAWLFLWGCEINKARPILFTIGAILVGEGMAALLTNSAESTKDVASILHKLASTSVKLEIRNG